MWSYYEPCTIRLNDSRNVGISMYQTVPTIAGELSMYFIEFHTNISQVFYSIPADGALYMYFEGVLPEEARDAE